MAFDAGLTVDVEALDPRSLWAGEGTDEVRLIVAIDSVSRMTVLSDFDVSECREESEWVDDDGRGEDFGFDADEPVGNTWMVSAVVITVGAL